MTAVAVLVLCFGTAQLIAGALTVGVTIDEPPNVDGVTNWVVDRSFFSGPYAYIFGPAYEALAHGANVLAGNNSLHDVSRSAAAYDVRHLTVAALALLSVAAVGGAVWRISGSRRFALWSAAALLAMPAWMGHGFFAPKDIPSGTAYTLVTVALVLALLARPGVPSSVRFKLLIGSMLAGGIVIGAGTRFALWLPFMASVATYAVLRLGRWRLGGIDPDRGADLTILAGVATGFGAVAVLYPTATDEPLTFLSKSVSSASDFQLWEGVTLTAGQLLSEHPPWWYLPTWIAATVPLLLGALAIFGGVVGIRALAAARSADSRSIWSRPELGLLLILQQALLLPVAAVITGATMYDGARQYLFVLPALAVLAGFGAERFWTWTQAKRPERRWRAIAAGVLAAALLFPMAEQTLLFPYNYTYINPVAGIGGVNDRWETDYLYASAPEGLSRTPRSSSLLCVELAVRPVTVELSPCTGDFYEPFMARRGEAVDERWEEDRSAVWAVGVKRSGNRPPDRCEQVDNVTRWLRGERVTMSYVLRCSP